MSGGSTVVSRRADVMDVLTESRAGNYVFGDLHYAQLGAVSEDDCALTVRATVIYKLNEEHGYVRYDPAQGQLRVGGEVGVIPYHSCVVANLVDKMFLFDGNEYVRSLTVDARGKSY